MFKFEWTVRGGILFLFLLVALQEHIHIANACPFGTNCPSLLCYYCNSIETCKNPTIIKCCKEAAEETYNFFLNRSYRITQDWTHEAVSCAFYEFISEIPSDTVTYRGCTFTQMDTLEFHSLWTKATCSYCMANLCNVDHEDPEISSKRGWYFRRPAQKIPRKFCYEQNDLHKPNVHLMEHQILRFVLIGCTLLILYILVARIIESLFSYFIHKKNKSHQVI